MIVKNKKGVSLIEVVVSMSLIGLIFIIFSASFTSVKANRVNKNRAAAFRFAQAEMNALSTLNFNQLTNRTNSAFLGLAYNHGEQNIASDLSAQSGTQVTAIVPVNNLTNNVSSALFLSENAFKDFTFRSYLKVLPQSTAGWRTGIVFRYQDIENYYYLSFSSNSLELYRVDDGVESTLYSEPSSISEGTWYSLKVVTVADSLEIYLNESLVSTIIDDTFTSGSVGVVGRDNTYLHVDDLHITSTLQTNTWNFDSQSVGEFPQDMLDVAPVISGIDGTLTIQDYLGLTDVKEIIVSVAWTEKADPKDIQLRTLRVQ